MFVAERIDGAFDREVLCTFLRPKPSQAEAKRIFDIEVALQAQLDHPGIAKVYGAGTTEGGIPYLLTEYLPGADIEVHLDEHRLSLRERIPYFLQICEAVQHAHDQGIVGLNLQAENVHMLADDSVRLVVYGLAPSNDPSVPSPPWPQFAVDYASPEEWEGQPTTAASDVYSLGVLLHRLLTGLLPKTVQGLTPAEVAERAKRTWSDRASARFRNKGTLSLAQSRGTDLRGLTRALRGDLDRILDRALAQDPSARYPSPDELREDLQRHLDGQPIKARGSAPLYAFRRSLVRHRYPIAVTGLVLGALSWAVGHSLVTADKAEAAWHEAQEAEQDADYQSRRLQELCVRFLTELGPSMQGRKGLEEARRYLLNAGAPLLDHLRSAGREDRRLHRHLAISYLELAEADWMARDKISSIAIPDSVSKARRLNQSYLETTPPGQTPDGMVAWARSFRAGIWFTNLTLDQAAGWELLEQADSELQAAGLTEDQLPALAALVLMDARRLWYSQNLRFGKAWTIWEREKIEEFEKRDPALAPFIKGDRPRFEGYRARYLVRTGRVREALLLLPSLVYVIQEENHRHSPPLLDLLVLEADTWLLLALARAYSGVPTGEALSQAQRVMGLIESQYLNQGGGQETLAGCKRWLGECLWVMGREHWAEAEEVTLSAIGHWETILRGDARWPFNCVQLARCHWQRAAIARGRNAHEEARQSLTEARRLLTDLPESARQHPYTRWVAALTLLESKALDPQGETPSWGQVEHAIESVRTSEVHSHLVENLEQDWKQLLSDYPVEAPNAPEEPR